MQSKHVDILKGDGKELAGFIKTKAVRATDTVYIDKLKDEGWVEVAPDENSDLVMLGLKGKHKEVVKEEPKEVKHKETDHGKKHAFKK